MEYMACGLPVVCTDCGGNPELVVEGRTGHLIPPSDDELLAVRLRDLRDDPARAQSMGHAGARRLGESFTLQAMVDNCLSIYHWACDR
jgi:glycosyltransferase involved in cell wall biosynthesis